MAMGKEGTAKTEEEEEDIEASVERRILIQFPACLISVLVVAISITTYLLIGGPPLLLKKLH